MSDDGYTLAEARAIIDAETCVRDDEWSRCITHGAIMGKPNRCRAYPEVAAVAAQLLATVERVQGIAEFGHHADTCGYMLAGGCPSVYCNCWKSDVRNAINGGHQVDCWPAYEPPTPCQHTDVSEFHAMTSKGSSVRVLRRCEGCGADLSDDPINVEEVTE